MSALRDAMSHAALGWVKPELDETLRQVRNEVEYYVEDPADDSRMRFCAGYLHQVQGTLRMVELYAPAMVAEELELLANAVRDGRVPDRDEACATLMRGTVLLPDYLERLQNGHRDIPIVLLPLLNEIRAARGEEGINESVLLAFDPDAVNASEAELDHARGSLSGRNRELLDTVGSAVKEELLRIKDALDLHMRTGSESSQLQTQVNELTAVADTLGVLGLGIARGVVVQQRDALREVVTGEQAVDETLLLDIAGALLYVDASLDDQVAHLGANIDGAGDASSLETRRTVEVLAHEAIANFAAAREAFVAFIETNWDHQRLVEVPRLLDEVAGALRMLDLQLPADYLSGVRQYIDTELLGRQRVPGGRQLDTLADAMASLEYYLEALRDRRPGREDILDITRSSLETLRYWPLPQRAPEQNADGPTVAEVSAPEATAVVQGQDAAIAEAAATGTAAAPISSAATAAGAAGAADAVEPGNAPRPYTLVFEKALEPFVPAPIAGLEVRPSLALDSDPVSTSSDSQGFDPVFAEEGLVADDSYHIAPLDLSGDGTVGEEDVGLAGVEVSADVSAAWPVASVSGEAVASATPGYGFDRSLLEDDGTGLPAALDVPAAINAQADAEAIAFSVSDDPAAPVSPIDGVDRDLLDDGDIAAAAMRESADAEATAVGFAALVPGEMPVAVDLEQNADPDPLQSHAAVPSPWLPEMPAAIAAATDGVAAEPVASPSAFPPIKESRWTAATPPPLPDIASASSEREPAQFSAQQVEAAFAAHREDAEAAAFMAQLDAAAAAFEPQTAASAPVAVPESAAVTELAGGFEDNGEDIDQDIREVFIEEFDEELVNLGNLLPIWRASPGNMDRLRPLRRVFHTLKGSGRLVGARILGEFAWKIEGMLNRVLDGSRPASPAVVSLVTQAYEVLPELNAALRGQGKISSDLLAMQAVADRIAAGEEAFHIVPALSPASAATAATAAPTLVVEGTPAVVDSVLLEILEAEIASHLETMREWLSGAQPQSQPASEELLRAVHTMSGAFAMTDVPEITAVTVPAESFVKRSLAAAITPSDAGVDALSDTVAAIATTIIALRAPAPRIPSFAGLAARLQELVDALPEAKWPPVAEEELAEIEALTRDRQTDAGQEASGPAAQIAAVDPSLSPVVEDQAPIEPASVGGFGFEPDIEVGGTLEPADSVAAADQSLPRVAEEPVPLDAAPLSELVFEPVIEVEQTTGPADPVVEADSFSPPLVEDPASLEGARASGLELEIETAETFSPADEIAEADHSLPQAGSDQHLIEAAPRSDGEAGAETGTATPASVIEDVELEVELADVRGTASLPSLPASDEDAPIAPTIDAVPGAVGDSHDTVEAEAEAEAENEVEVEVEVESEAPIASLPEEHAVPALQAGQQSGPGGIAAQALAPFADVTSASLVDADRGGLAAAEDVLIESPSFADSTQIGQAEAIAGQQVTAEEVPAGSATVEAEALAATLREATAAPVAAITAVREPTGSTEAVAEPAAQAGNASGQEELAEALAIDEGALDFRELDQDLVDIFVEEGQDLLDHCDGLISELRAAPDDREALAGLQRDLHTLKGGARMAGINAIGDLGHAIESLLEAVAAQRTELARADVQLLERGFDRLHQLLTRTGKHRAVAMPHDLIAAFDARTEGRDQAAASEQDLSEVTALAPSRMWAAAVAAVPASASEPQSVATAALAPLVSADFAAPLSAPVAEEVASDDEGASRTQEQVRVRSDLLDRLVNHAGEVAIYRSRLEQQLGAFRGAMGELDRTNARLRDQLRRLDLETEAQIVARYRREQEQVDQTFDPLELDRFSTLQQLSRALNESAADLGGLQGVLDDLSRNYDSLLQQQSRVSSELQDGLMRARMVPFDGLVPRLRRVVRQAAQETGKQVQLSLEGTHGELDRNVLDRMVAPLEHMLRNSVAHGLESPAQRRAAGKPEEGGIVLRLRREGSEIVLEVADDGAGLNRAAIRQRAEQRGLIAVDAQISDSELDELIFASGFSTSEQVSQLAGRGVGMDVVRNEVRQLGGSIDIDSVPGHGVTFTLRLPQTLAVTQAVFVQIGETTFAVPVASVSGIGRIARERFESDEGRYHYNGEEFALHDLGSLVGQAAAKAEGQAQIPLLLVRAGDLRVAVAIDQVLGNREIVVKPVGLQIASVPGIYGATITGDGNVVVILDVAPLVRRHLAQPQAPVLAPASTGQRQVPMVMVVDDSLTMRKVTGRVLERHNFEVVVARDGIEALERLEERVPDLMLLDIEMPRMDGYELATAMRADPRFKGVPIVMITSRSGDKHRQRAFEIGVQRYLGKPYQELDLMRNVYDLLGIARVRQ